MPNFNLLRPFILPQGLSLSQQLDFCLSVIDRYRKELPPLRRANDVLQKQKENLEKEIAFWKEKYQREKEEKEEREKEIGKLKQEIAKLTKTNSRYQVALFDHGNFKSPQEEENKKEKGGQTGHKDTNREKQEDYSSFSRVRLFARECSFCHHKLKRASSTKQKILLDIVLNPKVVKMVLESERQWCNHCQREVITKDERCLPFTEYGLNTFLLVLILRFKCHLSFANISQVFFLSYGLKLSKSAVSSILSQAKIFLHSRYDQLLKEVREGNLIYGDETGWLVHGQAAWLWIMASQNTTVYFAAESRGKGIAKELFGKSLAYYMHDGYVSYADCAPLQKQCYCWAHLLRFAFEETFAQKKNSPALFLREELVAIFLLKKQHPEYSEEQLKNVLTQRLENILQISSPNQAIINILQRVKTQKEGLINGLLFTPDGTNNLAERELRPMVISKRISFGSDTFSGMETSAVLGSIVQTLSKKEESLLSNLQFYLKEGLQKAHYQYFHRAYYDSS